MQDSRRRRYAFALLLAVLAGLLIHFYNPMDHLKADLRADTQGVRLSFEVAVHAVEKVCPSTGVLPKLQTLLPSLR